MLGSVPARFGIIFGNGVSVYLDGLDVNNAVKVGQLPLHRSVPSSTASDGRERTCGRRANDATEKHDFSHSNSWQYEQEIYDS